MPKTEHRRILVVLIMMMFSFAPSLFGQSKIDLLFESVSQSDVHTSIEQLKNFETTELTKADDTLKCDFLYVKGYFYEKHNNTDEAVKWYRRHVLMSDSLHYYDPSFFDATLRTMLWDKDNGLDDEAITLGMTAIHAPKSKQPDYPNQYLLYISLAATMNKTFRYADVPEIAEKGMPYVKLQADPGKEEYYQLPFCETIAWCLMGNEEKADSVCRWMSSQSASQTEPFASSLDSLRNNIQWLSAHGMKERKDKAWRDIERMNRSLPLYGANTKKGAQMFHEYFSIIRNALAYFYFDINSADDEMLWNRWLTNLMTSLYIYCDSLPGREGEAYDNEITRKDFLSYHTGRFRSKPMRWGEIQKNLSEGEAAIEISSFPEEVIILKKHYPQPKCIEIDKQLAQQLEGGLADEPLVIADYYSMDGPVARLWQMLEPELQDIRTVYISGSNYYSQINYSAIPLNGHGTVGDKYNVHFMFSTSALGNMKSTVSNFSDAAIFGGIDYDNATYENELASVNCADEPWDLTRGMSDDLRNGFNYLPASKTEVLNIDSIIKAHHIHDYLLMDKEATEETFKALDGKAPDVLHISTHGFMLANELHDTFSVQMGSTDTHYKNFLSRSGLLFAGANKAWKEFRHSKHNDGILTSREIMQLDLSGCKLAALSACKSAMGEIQNLTGLPFGVAYALKLAGVKQVLCSLWSINDRATSVFMKSFYKHLFDLKDAEAALKQAQNEMRNSKEYSSPYYWASFVIVN